jgi:ATP-dependent Lhr-like helicase
VVEEARPEPRDREELHDALLRLVAVPVAEPWRDWLDALTRDGRAAVVHSNAGPLALAAEHALLIDALYPDAPVSPTIALPPHLVGTKPARADAVLAAVRGHAEIIGPFEPVGLAARLGLEPWEVAVAAAQLESDGVVLRGRFTPGKAEDEFCDRRLLARIHRYTLDRLRSEIEPVSAQDFLRYLFERHRLTQRTRAGGRAALREAVAMLQGFEAAAAAWERDVLAPRVAGYRAEWLDELCLAGEAAWARLSPRRSTTGASATTSRATPITLALRRDMGWLLEAVRGPLDPEPPTSPAALATLHALRRRGALFLDDLAVEARLPRCDLTEALWDLVGRGVIAGDGFQPLRELMTSARGRAARGGRRSVQGRWALVERPQPGATPVDELADHVAGQLLARYGVVFRELASRESFTVPWREVSRALRRREARGIARGGRFVAGFLGEQYALPEAVEALRRIRREPRADVTVVIRATDPCNLVGVVTPGARVPVHHGPSLVFRDGAFVAAESQHDEQTLAPWGRAAS